MANYYHGKDGVIKVAGNPIASVTEFAVNETAETADVTAKGDNSKVHIAGRKSWDGSVKCFYDPADANGQNALTPGAEVALEFYPCGVVTGKPKITGNAHITKADLPSPKDGAVEISFTYQGSGALTHTVVP